MSTIRVVNLQHTDATEPNIVLESDGTATFVSGITISGGTNLTVSGTAEFASGTVSAPGITFIDDNNTGVYSPGTDQVAISTNGTAAVIVNASQQVGIGTTSPNSPGSYAKTLEVSNADSASIVLSRTNSTAHSLELGVFNGNSLIESTGAASLRFKTNSSERMRIDSSGNIGIGTTSPGHVLTVRVGTANQAIANFTGGTVGRGLVIETDNDGGVGDDTVIYNATQSTGSHVFKVNSSEQMRIDSSGRVGIGTASPQRALVVSDAGAEGFEFYPGSSDTANTLNHYDRGSSAFIDIINNADQHIFGRADGEKMRIDSSGRLLKSGEASLTSTSLSHPVQIAADGSAQNIVCFGRASDDISAIDFYEADKSTNLGEIQYRPDHVNFRHRVGDIRFATGGTTERMRIDSSGNVGIGTSAPRGKLHLHSSSSTRFDLTNTATGTNSGDGSTISIDSSTGALNIIQRESQPIQFYTGSTEKMRIDSSGNVVLKPTNPAGVSGSNSNYFGFRITQTNGQSALLGTIRAEGQSAWGGALIFHTKANNGTPNDSVTERMRIDSSGNLLVGKTATNFANAGVEIRGAGEITLTRAGDLLTTRRLTSEGVHISIRAIGGSVVGSVSSNGTNASFNTSSDYRLKENVVNITDGITRVKQLQPKRFNFIVNAERTVDGFLAHEAQTVVPEAVTGTHNEVDDGGNAVMQSIDQSKLVPLLTAALQEAIAKIETLEAKVAAFT